jgi:hypothetical protein
MTEDEIEAALARARVPAIAMLRTPQPTDAGTPGCWFGGEPTLPPEIEWPVYTHEESGLDIPMHFLVQMNLAHLPTVPGLLPGSGTLFVFYDPAVAPISSGILGDEPTPMVLGTGAKVIFSKTDFSECSHRSPPTFPELKALSVYEVSSEYEGTTAFKHWPFVYSKVDTFPRSLSLPKRTLAGEHALKDGDGSHRLFGASQQQRFPSREHLDLSGYPKYPPLTSDHVLLFRIVSDPDIGHYYVGCQDIGFWIKRDDLSQRVFDNVVVWKDC